MYIAILGRQPALGMAELERIYGAHATRWFASSAAVVEADSFDIERVGGSQKAGRVVLRIKGDWRHISDAIVRHYTTNWAERSGKTTLGISAYGYSAGARDVQRIGLLIKSALKGSSGSLRLIPNTEPALNTATSHHNKLGLSANKVELLIVRGTDDSTIVAESIGAQNITALARRDQGRPKRDAFVGMLSPKLALMIVNLAVGESKPESEMPKASSKIQDLRSKICIMDPFCGTGVILQEALLLGYNVYGTDLNPKMIDYTRTNLDWLAPTFHIPNSKFHLGTADATSSQWNFSKFFVPNSTFHIATEAYLGQPFSAPPSPAKLTEVVSNCDHIISTFLRNIAPQLAAGTSICLAVPAWRDAHGGFTHLPFIDQITKLGYRPITLSHVRPEQLLYYRESQVVARQLLLLQRV